MTDSLAAFNAYDFESDPQWRAYQANLEIPAGVPLEQTLTKFKAKWYKRQIDPSFDAAGATLGSSQAAPSAAQSSKPPSHEAVPPPREVPQNGSSGAKSQAAPKAKGFLQRMLAFAASSSEERLFFMHMAILVFTVLHLQPIVRMLSARSWGYFMQTAVLTHGYKVYLRYGAPKIWPFSFQAIKAWGVPAAASTDFQYAIIAAVFITAKPIILVMVPFLSLAVYHVFAYLAKHYSNTALWHKYGASANAWLQSRQQAALLYNAAAEIGAGFLVILSLVAPPRSIFLVYIYWQFLKMRYWSPDAATYHRAVWTQMNGKVGRYLDFVPLLRVPVGFIQRWFQAGPQAAQ